jgi:hypothetical protein
MGEHKTMKLCKGLRTDTIAEGAKFIRRTDLTPSIRLYIAYTALMARSSGIWGAVSELSRRFMISRMFIYTLSCTLERHSQILFGDNRLTPPAIEEKLQRLPYQYIVSLRLEGQCSIGAISTIMKRFDIDLSSVGSISRILYHFGSLLPNTLTTDGSHVQLVVFASDELFCKSSPILITVDPVSSAILRIELADSRKVDDWKKHWKCLEDNGYCTIYLVSDEGKSLCQAQKQALVDSIRQSDTFHALAHRLGRWVNTLEQIAHKAIREEYECYDKLDSAKSERVINKRIEKYEEAKRKANEKIDLYEAYCFLYGCLIEALQIFDHDGNVGDRDKAEESIKLALELIETLGVEKITEAVHKARRTVPELLNYFDKAQQIVTQLAAALSIPQEALQALCLAWQWRKGMIKSKKAEARRRCARKEQSCLELAIGYLQEDYDHIKEHVYGQLDHIVQSSALVECINSIIRPYLNTSRNQITQETLNLIMFYHNHRRYKSGKRKDKTPNEILTGRRQEKDWIELLFEIVEQKNPALFASSN